MSTKIKIRHRFSIVCVAMVLAMPSACTQLVPVPDPVPLPVVEPPPAPVPEPQPVEWGTPPTATLDSGRVILHRLNNAELQRSAQVLLASELEVSHLLPPDATAHGFTNIAEALSTSVLYLEGLEGAVDALIADGLRPPITSQTSRYQPEEGSWSGNGIVPPANGTNMGSWNEDRPSVLLYHGASQSGYVSIAHPGRYHLRVVACHEGFGNTCPESQALPFAINNEVVAEFEVSNRCRQPATYDTTLEIASGQLLLTVGGADTEACDGSHHAVDWIELEGPLDATGELPPGRAKLYVCDPEPEGATDSICARRIVHEFMDQAWRRPVTDAEVDAVMSVYDSALAAGADVHEALALGVKRTLLSPWFVFRVEEPDSPTQPAAQPLSAHELANRLAYALWSRHPDDELRARADDNTLLDAEVLEAQTRRLLSAPQAESLVTGFGAQWLGLKEFDQAMPDPGSYPDFDDSLRQAMDAELRDLVRRALFGDLSMLGVLTAETTWVEPRLAEHYGVEQAQAGYLAVDTRSRAGLLTTGAFLTATSTTTRTSPVRRGHWVAKHIMCEDPPPPPDGVEQEFDESEGSATVVEQLAAHRADPACASCHDQLDPIGIALENFDGIGAHRTEYSDGSVIDASGNLIGVGSFADIAELSAGLASQPRTHRCMVQKALTYMLGRKLRADDWPFIAPVEQRFVTSGHSFEELMVGIVQSEVFTHHRGTP
jgi:hypothetical protein